MSEKRYVVMGTKGAVVYHVWEVVDAATGSIQRVCWTQKRTVIPASLPCSVAREVADATLLGLLGEDVCKICRESAMRNVKRRG